MIACGKLLTVASCFAFVACAGESADRSGEGDAPDTADIASRDSAGGEPTGATGPALRADGFGDMDVGITLIDATDRAGTAAVDPDPAAECRYVTFPTLPEGVSLMVIGDTIRRIDVDSPAVLSDRGAGIGMPASRIEALYGADLERMPHKYEPDGEYLIVTGEDLDTRLVFETAADTVRAMRAGLMPQVMWVERCG